MHCVNGLVGVIIEHLVDVAVELWHFFNTMTLLPHPLVSFLMIASSFFLDILVPGFFRTVSQLLIALVHLFSLLEVVLSRMVSQILITIGQFFNFMLPLLSRMNSHLVLVLEGLFRILLPLFSRIVPHLAISQCVMSRTRAIKLMILPLKTISPFPSSLLLSVILGLAVQFIRLNMVLGWLVSIFFGN